VKLERNKQNIDSIQAIGILVRKQRFERNLSQIEAASLCNVGVRFLSDLENGKESVRLDLVFKVLKTFGLKVFIESKKPNGK
jgi:transcriptional regulator with XRE-family HTH domain